VQREYWGDFSIERLPAARKQNTFRRISWIGGQKVNEESDRMMVLLQELAALKASKPGNFSQDLVTKKRRREITQEMKRLAAEKQQESQ
jgi:hypothetical protein